jgi:hypothetical protein
MPSISVTAMITTNTLLFPTQDRTMHDKNIKDLIDIVCAISKKTTKRDFF